MPDVQDCPAAVQDLSVRCSEFSPAAPCHPAAGAGSWFGVLAAVGRSVTGERETRAEALRGATLLGQDPSGKERRSL